MLNIAALHPKRAGDELVDAAASSVATSSNGSFTLMSNIAIALIVLSAATWLGAIVFQSTVVASSLFSVLAVDDAGKVLRVLFPRFFVLGLICGALMLVGLAALAVDAGIGAMPLQIAGLTIAMLACQSIALALVPRINAARDAGPAAKAKFARLHGASVVLTIVVMLMAVGVLVIVGNQAAGGILSA